MTRLPSPRVLPWLAAGVLAVALAIVMWLWAPWRAAPAGVSAMQMTPLSFEQGGQTGAVWSPDGKAVAYGARQKDTDSYQVYVRYLDSPVATKITSTAAGVQNVVEWTAGKIIFYTASQLWSVSPVGGEPEPWARPATPEKLQLVGTASVTRDGAAVAALFRGADGMVSLWIAAPGGAPKPYEPAPFASRSSLNTPSVKFSPAARISCCCGTPVRARKPG